MGEFSARRSSGLAGQPAHRLPHLPDLPLSHDRLVGRGAVVPVQRRVPAAARQQAPGTHAAGQRSLGRDLGHHRPDARLGDAHRPGHLVGGPAAADGPARLLGGDLLDLLLQPVARRRRDRARGVAEACDLVVRSLERAPEVVPFAAVYLRGPDGEASLARSVPDRSGGSGGWPVDEVLRDGEPVTVTDVIARFGELPAGGWDTPPAEAMVLPLTGGTGEPAGAIVLAASAGRALDEAYESFLGLVAQQTAALVNSAVAYQAQLRRAEELAELDRAKTAFFSNVSHEFRTPLTLIMGPVEELRARLDPADPADAAVAGELDVIHRNGLRLGKLVNTLLDFSRIEAGRMQASYEPLDLGAFTTELASVFH